MILQPAAFWRREVYETVGLLDESLHFVLDWDYWLRCQEHFRIEFFDEFLACNRRYESTKTEAGGINCQREIAELLLKSGKFTQRAIQAYLAEPIYCAPPASPPVPGSFVPNPRPVPRKANPAVTKILGCLSPRSYVAEFLVTKEFPRSSRCLSAYFDGQATRRRKANYARHPDRDVSA